MIAAWFSILCLMVGFFLVLEGWDFGVGALHYVVAKNQGERRVLIAALGPLWSWHEVWLVGTGGVLFVAFPKVLAIGFPAYYLALFLVLWTLIARGVSLEFRGHIDADLWRSFWDFVFSSSSILLAILVGTASGNILRGMPLEPSKPLTLPLFTTFAPFGEVGILDWYTVSVALFTLVCFTAHGAAYLALKVEEDMHSRTVALSNYLWIATLTLLVVVAAETGFVRPDLFRGMAANPLAWGTSLVAVGGTCAIFRGWRKGNDTQRFLGGCAVIAGLFMTAAAAVYPVMLHSTLKPDYSVTAANGSSDISNLVVASYWWPIALLFALVYFAFIGKHYRGRVQVSQDTQIPY